MPWTVYQIRVDGEELPFYIGCTSRSSYRRWIEHKHRAVVGTENTAKNRKIIEAKSTGKAIIVEDLEIYENQQEAHTRERFWIDHYGRHPSGPLVNDIPGGFGEGKIVGGDARKKMAAAKIGNKINVGRQRDDFRTLWVKTVSAYSAEGAWLGTWSSSREAANSLGLNFKLISQVLTGKCRTTKGPDGQVFQFKFGDKQDVTPVKHRSRMIK